MLGKHHGAYIIPGSDFSEEGTATATGVVKYDERAVPTSKLGRKARVSSLLPYYDGVLLLPLVVLANRTNAAVD